MNQQSDPESLLVRKVLHLVHEEENAPDLSAAIMQQVNVVSLTRKATHRHLQSAGIMAVVALCTTLALAGLSAWWGPYLEVSLATWINAETLEGLVATGFFALVLALILAFEPLFGHYFRRKLPPFLH